MSIVKAISFLLLLLTLSLSASARAQSFDLTTGRVPTASLDGLWRFHTGDNPAWADPKFDDSQWSLLRSDRDWAQQGYKGYSGLAWYRFQVTVPAELDRVSIYLPFISTCYEAYADGRLIGTYGKMPPNTMPYRGGGYSQIFELPAASHVERKVEIALRVWQWPGWAMLFGGGPAGPGGLIGDTTAIEIKHQWDWAWDLWLGAGDEILSLLELLAGLGALALFVLQRKDREYLWFSLMMLLSATDEWIRVSENVWVWNYSLWSLSSRVFESGASLALVAFLVTLLQPRRTILLKLALASVAMVPVLCLLSIAGVVPDELQNLLESLLQLPLCAWLFVVVVAGARQRSLDARLLAAPVILSSSSTLCGYGLAISYELGWQHSIYSISLTQIPFPILLSQVTDALFILAVFGILILRFTRTRSEEERYAGEVQAARNVQQYLIPEHLPATPGLTIESVYRPAREVGGDFFQVLPDAADGSVLIVVGDVAGHGMESGMLATLIVGALRTANEFTSEPGRILSLLNKRMQGRGLATCLTLRIERDGSAALANAGHLPPYLNGEEMVMEGALPLGAIPGIEFPVLKFKLADSDTLMLMTDGVAEAQDAAGHLFGFDRIAEMLRKGVPARALASAAQSFGQEDDITVLTVRSVAA